MKTFASLSLLLLLSIPYPASAEIQRLGNLDVNYNVVPTETLTPQIAQAYGIERSKHRALLTVSASKANALGVTQPVSVDVGAYTVNMVEQQRFIKMRSVHEGGAIYYIGEFDVASPDFLRFTISVAEPNGGKPYKIEFQRNYDRP